MSPSARRRALRAATVAADRLPEATLRRALVAASRLGSGPTIGLPGARRVLVVAPHPDDETLVAGGTVHRLVRGGARATMVLCTAGEASRVPGTETSIAIARTREARAAATRLGIAEVHELGLPDGDLPGHLDELADALDTAIGHHRPDAVLTTWFGDGHRDHRAVNVALAALDDRHGDLPVWGGEMWTPVPATHLVDLDEADAVAKEEALAEHATAARVFDLTARLALDRYRSTNGLRGAGRAEAFVVTPLAGLTELLAALDER